MLCSIRTGACQIKKNLKPYSQTESSNLRDFYLLNLKLPSLQSTPKIVFELFRLRKISFNKSHESLRKLSQIKRYSPEIIADALISLMEKKMAKPTKIRIAEDLLTEIDELVQELNWTPWEFSTKLKLRNLRVNVDLEDWLNSAELPE